MTLPTLIFFALASMGLTHILVDSSIWAPVRSFADKHAPKKISGGMHCYQCTGFWSGLICGSGIFWTLNPFILLACGFAGSWLGSWSASYLDRLLGSDEEEDD